MDSKPCSEEYKERQNSFSPFQRFRQFMRKNRLVVPGVFLTLLLCSGTLLLNHFTFALHIKIDGEVVGTLADTEALEAVLYTAEETAQNILGNDIDLSERVSYTLRFMSAAETEHLDELEVERGILDQVEGIGVSYAVLLDGVPVGHVTDIAEIEALIEERTEALTEDGVISVTFLAELSFEIEVVDEEDIFDVDDLHDFIFALSVEVVEEILYTQEIPYITTIIYDDTLFIGEYEIVQIGEIGESEISAQVTTIDGREIQHTILEMKTLAEPLTHIIREGTLERPITASFGEYIWPTQGRLSSGFGPRRVSIGSSNHQGIDISAPAGTAVVAADGGEVIFAGWMGGFGNLIQIRHDNDHVTFYAHLRTMAVGVGERVYRGQYIGGVGMTGTASGNHLHFEIRINGTPVDPIPHLPAR